MHITTQLQFPQTKLMQDKIPASFFHDWVQVSMHSFEAEAYVTTLLYSVFTELQSLKPAKCVLGGCRLADDVQV